MENKEMFELLVDLSETRQYQALVKLMKARQESLLDGIASIDPIEYASKMLKYQGEILGYDYIMNTINSEVKRVNEEKMGERR